MLIFLIPMDLLRINIFYQCLVDFLLNLIINLFFQILNLQLLIFYMDDLEYMANFIMFGFIFIKCNSINITIKVDHFIFQKINLFAISFSLSHTLKVFVPYGYVLILSDVCNLLSSLLLSASLLISSGILCDDCF